MGLEAAREWRLIVARLGLSKEEEKALEYMIKNVSVGSIMARKELKALGIEDPDRVLKSLESKGLIENKGLCYNLSADLRDRLFRANAAFKYL